MGCRIFLAAAIASSMIACNTPTVEVPLTGVHVLRPSAGRSGFGVRIGAGVVQAPEIQGSVAEVHDPDGNVVNGVPDYRSDGIPVFNNGDYKTHGYGEIGFNLLERVELGWNSARGAFAFANVFDSEHFTLALSPSYKNDKTVSRDRQHSLQSGGKKFTTRVEDAGMASLASFFIGDRKSVGLTVYGGHTIHRYTASILDHRSAEKAWDTVIARGWLIGAGLDAKHGGIFFESALTGIPQRTGHRPNARTFATGGNFLIGN